MDSETLKKANDLANKIEHAKRDDKVALCVAHQPYYLAVGSYKDGRTESVSYLTEEQKRMLATMVAAFTSQNFDAYEAELAAL